MARRGRDSPRIVAVAGPVCDRDVILRAAACWPRPIPLRTDNSRRSVPVFAKVRERDWRIHAVGRHVRDRDAARGNRRARQLNVPRRERVEFHLPLAPNERPVRHSLHVLPRGRRQSLQIQVVVVETLVNPEVRLEFTD